MTAMLLKMIVKLFELEPAMKGENKLLLEARRITQEGGKGTTGGNDPKKNKGENKDVQKEKD